MDLKDIQNQNLDELLNKEKVVILEFYTSWCPSCKMVGMTLEEYEEEHDDVFILQVNADEYKEIANIYKVTTAPTMFFIYKGEVYNRHHGFIEVDEIEEIIDSILK